MKCETCGKNRSDKKFVVVSFMRKELIMCDTCFNGSNMKFKRRYIGNKDKS